MTVQVPTEYDPIDLAAGGGIVPGVEVRQAPLESIVANHNFMIATFRPPVVNWTSGAASQGVYSSAGSQKHLLVFAIPRNADGPGLTVKIRATNTAGSPTRIYATLTNGSTVTTSYAGINASTTNADLTISLASTASQAGGALLLITTISANAYVNDVIAYYDAETGTVSDAPKSSGLKWAQASEVAATMPLTVEFVNRILEAPRTVYRTNLGQVFCLADNLETALGSGYWKTTRTAYELVNRACVDIRQNKIDLIWSFFARGPTGSAIKVHLKNMIPGGPSHVFEHDITGTALPANPGGDFSMVSSSSTTMSGVHHGVYELGVWLKSGTGTAAQLWSLGGVQYK